MVLKQRSAGFCLLALILFTTGCGVQQGVLAERGLCAHRGASETHPENTEAAFAEAIRLGAHMIELDVHLTSDGHAVVIHDDTLDRTTNGHGKVSQHTLEQIRKLDAGSWKAKRFTGQRVPTLSEALRMMPVNVWVNVHVKGGADVGRAAARAIVEEGREHHAFLACGREAADAARAVSAELRICNMERQGGGQNYIDQTIESGAEFIQIIGEVTPDQIDALKQKGVRINYFGVRSEDHLMRLLQMGVDFPLVDDVARMMPKAMEAGIQPLKPMP